MPMVTDARFVRHRFDELFEIDHGKKESFRDKYRSFHLHEPTPRQEGAEAAPIQIATTPEGAKLVTIVFSARMGAEGEDVEGRLQEVRRMLGELLEPGERCHLWIERESADGEEVYLREARGYIAVPDSSEAM